MPTQHSFFKKLSREHGGSLNVNKRRSYRPLNTKLCHHITLKSHKATGGRCLLRHKSLIKTVMMKAANRFGVTVYNHAVAGNHLHLLVKGRSRIRLQNFFRVFAGHTAQQILKQYPLTKSERGGASATGAPKEPCAKNKRHFWGFLIYSRIVTWGREQRAVYSYIEKNTLEALGLIAYQSRRQKNKTAASDTS